MTYVKIGGKEYAAIINGSLNDYSWDNRESKSITTSELTFAEASALFVDGCSWSIVERNTVDGQEIVNEYDNSDYNIGGDITDHRDGTITVKMGKPTDLELAYEELYG